MSADLAPGFLPSPYPASSAGVPARKPESQHPSASLPRERGQSAEMARRKRIFGVLAGLPIELLERIRSVPGYSRQFLVSAPELHASQRELYRCACILRDAEFTEDEQEVVIKERFRGYYREIKERDISRAIQASLGAHRSETAARIPKVNETLVRSICSNSAGVAKALASASPTLNSHTIRTPEVLDRLYAPDALLCVGFNNNVEEPSGVRFVPVSTTASRTELGRREGQYELIVPNPMSAPKGLTLDGRISERCLANSARSWTYQVVEFDHGSEDEQAALILHLKGIATQATLKMVVHSGGKSLHAWFDVSRLHSDEQEKFRRYAAVVGADPAMFRLCQFARMPNAMRPEKNARQAVRYLA